MDRLNNVNRNYILAAVGEIPGFTPRISARALFEKRETCSSSSDNVCDRSGGLIWCCPKDYTCYRDDGQWLCDPSILGLTRGQKIGIAIGVTLAFFLLLAAAIVIFCCCCRKAAKIASAAVNNSNNQHGGAPQPVIYGNTQPYDPVAVPLTHQPPHPPQGTKMYGENTEYYQPQQAYDPYVHQQQQPTMSYQPTPASVPPYQPATHGPQQSY